MGRNGAWQTGECFRRARARASGHLSVGDTVLNERDPSQDETRLYVESDSGWLRNAGTTPRGFRLRWRLSGMRNVLTFEASRPPSATKGLTAGLPYQESRPEPSGVPGRASRTPDHWSSTLARRPGHGRIDPPRAPPRGRLGSARAATVRRCLRKTARVGGDPARPSGRTNRWQRATPEQGLRSPRHSRGCGPSYLASMA